MIQQILLVAVLFAPPPVKKDEAYWRDHFAPKYQADTDFRIPGTRRHCDLVTRTEAIEIDWETKHYEGLGQALSYGLALGRKPALLLLDRGREKDRWRIKDAEDVCRRYCITLYVEEVPE